MQVIFREQKFVNENGGPLKVIAEYDQICKGDITASFYDNCDDVPDPSTLDDKGRHVVVFDDCLEGPQGVISSFFTRGRHSNCIVFYLSQSYFKIPRQCIRGNANFIILFRQGKKDLQHIYQDHVALDDIPYDIFVNQFCLPSWNSSKHAFICLDLTRNKFTGKFRRNFDYFWIPQT